MSIIYVGSARHDENGKYVGGVAGDSLQGAGSLDLKGEVSAQEMYTHSKGWYILRPILIDNANKLADAMRILVNNANVGYDQTNRLGVIKYGIKSTIKTECDCSSAVRACIKYAMNKDVGNFTTADELKVLTGSKLFNNVGKYVNQLTTPVYNGDVLVTQTKGHTVIVISGNPRINTSSKYYPQYTGTSVSIVTALKEVGEKDTSYDHRKKIAKVNGVINYTGTPAQNTSLLKLLKSGLLIKA